MDIKIDNVAKLNLKKCKSYQEIRVKVLKDSIKSINLSIKKLKKFKISSFKTEKGGKYFKPISERKLSVVFTKYKNEIDDNKANL